MATETPPPDKATEPRRSDNATGEASGKHGAAGELYGYLAEYDTPGELVEAARKVKDAGYTEFDAYSPFPVHGIDPAMGIKRDDPAAADLRRRLRRRGQRPAPPVVLQRVPWGWNISGKPTWSIPANIPIAYELDDLARGAHVVLRHVGPQQAPAGLAPAVPQRPVPARHR